ncbi:MAG: ferritin-like domain-containing protein [Pseudomonadales bacterium]
MDIKRVENPPKEVVEFPNYDSYKQADDPQLTAGDVQHIVEIFNTPLTGSYNWDYSVQDDRIKKLYELGKQLNWNAEVDIDWSLPMQEHLAPDLNTFEEYGPYAALSEEGKKEVNHHMNAWTLSQFLHGEQGALLVASQLTCCAPSFNAKMYAASQTFDEARHVEAFNKLIQTRVGHCYPVDPSLKYLLDKILTDPRWDLKFIGMQLVIEGFALSAFTTMKSISEGSVVGELLHYVIRDEARHVTFGVNYLEAFVKTLTEDEKEDRAMFAYEACVVARERLIPTGVFEHFGWDVAEARELYLRGPLISQFRNLLFSKIVPNLRRIGLLTDAVRPKFEELGILEFEHMPDDYDIDWAEISKPLNAA